MSKNKMHVIVQAGGRGSRLRHHTWNKPKCLVSVRGKPLLYHLFDRYKSAKYFIIGDYAYDQLEIYLQINPPIVDYQLIRAAEKGTLSGIADALKVIPQEAPVLLIWADLILGELPEWPDTDKPVVCTTSAFTCRWTATSDGQLRESPAAVNGIPGLFYFPTAHLLSGVTNKGEFVKWFSANIAQFHLLDCPNMEELGDFSAIEESNDRAGFCRFFNKVEMTEKQVIKTVVDPDYEELHRKEIAWYKEAKRLGFRRIPDIYSENPLILERIQGHHAYQMHDLSTRERRAVLADYLDALITLHDRTQSPTIRTEVEEVYLTKTISRVHSISRLIPGFDRDYMTVNGKKCLNPFSEKNKDIIEKLLISLYPNYFTPIHGDPTFSNTLVDGNLRVWFIDPRGYFSKAGIMGDPWYDFAKVYYSAVGGYDIFNRRKFKLHVDDETVEVLMERPLFSDTASEVFYEYFSKNLARIEVLHGLIWLSLSGYAKDDIDSVIGAFYLGLYWLETGNAKA